MTRVAPRLVGGFGREPDEGRDPGLSISLNVVQDSSDARPSSRRRVPRGAAAETLVGIVASMSSHDRPHVGQFIGNLRQLREKLTDLDARDVCFGGAELVPQVVQIAPFKEHYLKTRTERQAEEDKRLGYDL